jgi:hypothetical protein
MILRGFKHSKNQEKIRRRVYRRVSLRGRNAVAVPRRIRRENFIERG